MRIRLTEKANMANGGYSWIKQGTYGKEEDVTGLELEAWLDHVSEDVIVVMVDRDEFIKHGFTGFHCSEAYPMKEGEFTVIED